MRNSTLWLMVKTLPAKDTIEVSQDESVSIRCSALHLFAPIDKRSKSLAFHAGVTGSNPVRSTIWLCSSIGRALACHARGSGIETRQSRQYA